MSEIKHTPAQMIAVRDALAESLGDAYDCTRVWSAWGVGTMSEDDFVPINEDDERMHEITIAALDAAASSAEPTRELSDDELDDILREFWGYQGVPSQSHIIAAMRAAIAATIGSRS